MSTTREPAAAPAQSEARPQLLFFYRQNSGPSRRVEGFLAQVLQRRKNHETFRLLRVDYEERPDLARRCGVEEPPALVVVHERRVRARIERPRGCTDIRAGLAAWLH
jgi:hypothetical protein